VHHDRSPECASQRKDKKKNFEMTNKNPRRDGITAGAAGKVDVVKLTSPPLPDQAHRDANDLRVERIATQFKEADDLRVEQIAAQLEEAEQQRLTDDLIKEQQHPDADARRSPPSSFLMDAQHVVGTPLLRSCEQPARIIASKRRSSIETLEGRRRGREGREGKYNDNGKRF
jgi:hypothetical protein